jgi:hypothetical protein
MQSPKIGLFSAITYTGISLVLAGIFLLVTIIGQYSWVARGGGAAWIFILSMIILMPLVTSYYKRKYRS